MRSERNESTNRASKAFHSLFRDRMEELEKIGRATIIYAMLFTVTIDRDEDGAWVAECPSIPGCVSQGETKEEALENVREAIAACLEVRAERGMPLTVETRQVEIAV